MTSRLQRIRKYDNPTWTKEVKKELTKLGQSKGYYVCTHSVKFSDWGEWLYDLCWIQQKDDSTYPLLKKFVLALESEWKTDDNSIIEDFQKLLVCNAEIKVMIFQCKPELKKYMIKSIKHIGDDQSKYILACFNPDKGEFDYL